MLNRPRKQKMKKKEKLYPKICITNLLCQPAEKKNIFVNFYLNNLDKYIVYHLICQR